jgi:hypothetical protein
MLIFPILPVRGDYSILPSTDGKPVSGLIANVDLELIESKFSAAPITFRIDPGAACSAMSLKRAEHLNLLRETDRVVDLRSRTASVPATMQQVRIGAIIARIAKLRSTPFTWPIVFYPNWPETTPLLLGLAGVISDLSFSFNGTPTIFSAYGSVTITLRSLDNQPS